MRRKPSWSRPGPAPLPRIYYAEEAIAAYARKVRRRTRRLFPVVAVLVVLRVRDKRREVMPYEGPGHPSRP